MQVIIIFLTVTFVVDLLFWGANRFPEVHLILHILVTRWQHAERWQFKFVLCWVSIGFGPGWTFMADSDAKLLCEVV